MSEQSPPRPALLFVGTFLPQTVASRAVSEDVAARLAHRGWPTTLSSRRRARGPRLLDLLWSAATTRAAVGHLDVYSGAAFRTAEFAARVLGVRGIPYVATLHGGHLPVWRNRHGARLRQLLQRAAAVVAPSPWLARELAGDRGDIVVIPNGIVMPPETAGLPERLEPRIGWLRAFDTTYRPELAVEVAERLATEMPQLHLEMVGPDKGARQSTKARIETLGLGHVVRLGAGVPKDHVGAKMAAWEIFLNTSAVDNAPVTVVEAMASARPVVSVRVGGVPDLLNDDVEGLLVEADVEALATAIRRLTLEPGLAARLGAAGRRRAEGHSWEVVMPQWESLFAAVAAGSSG